MDNKGFISIEYLFSIFVILIIAIPLLFLSQSAIQSSFDIDDGVGIVSRPFRCVFHRFVFARIFGTDFLIFCHFSEKQEV